MKPFECISIATISTLIEALQTLDFKNWQYITLHRVDFYAFVDNALKNNAATGRYEFNSSNINRMILENLFNYSYGRSVYQLAKFVR